MTDAHYHRDGYATFLSLGGREFRFCGLHPWQVLDVGDAARLPLREQLSADPHAGVGEIGLDRLKEKTVSPAQRAAFAAQLEVAAEFGRPVVLHGAKCWGEVVAACRSYAGRIPAFLFHGFSRSGGLLPEIAALNGFVGVGAALLNDHAVNYRALAREIPLDRLLVETDADYAERPPRRGGPTISQPSPGRARSPSAPQYEILCKLAELRGMEPDALEAAVDANAARFVEALA